MEVSLWETVKGVAADIVQLEHNYLKGNKSEGFFLDRKMSGDYNLKGIGLRFEHNVREGRS